MTAISRILVVGATGTIGRVVVTEAATHGLTPVAASRNPERAARTLGVEAVAFDTAHIDEALAGVDAVVLTHGGDANPEAFLTTSKAVIDGAARAGIPVALMTSMNVSRIEGPYADLIAPKHDSEVYLRASNVPHYIIVRPGWFGYQKEADVALDIRQGDKVTGQPGVDVRHIARTLLWGVQLEKNYTIELFSKPGVPTESVEEFTQIFADLVPDVRGADKGALD